MGAAEITGILLTIVTASMPLLLAATGELVTERAGVLNLGVEGMMIVGAVVGFVAGHLSGMPVVAILAAILAGAAMAALFAVATLVFVTNQVASGLALTIMGLGLAALIGDRFVSVPGHGLERLKIPVLGDIPIIGPLIFGEDLRCGAARDRSFLVPLPHAGRAGVARRRRQP